MQSKHCNPNSQMSRNREQHFSKKEHILTKHLELLRWAAAVDGCLHLPFFR